MRAGLLVMIAALPLAVGCGGGNRLIVGEIRGPASIVKGAGVEYSVEASGDTGITYRWAVDPWWIGSFSDQASNTTAFHAGHAASEMTAVIRVVVNSDRDGPVVRSIDIVFRVTNNPPVAMAYAEPTEVNPGMFVGFFDESIDPDDGDVIVKREWDFSYDEEEGFHPGSEEREPRIQYTTEGLFRIQLRVTDSGGLTDMLDEPLEVSVISGPLRPVARATVDFSIQRAGSPLHFDGGGSYDPDGEVVRHEWDWEGGGIYDDEGAQVAHTYDSPGLYPVQLRVTDNDGIAATLAKPVEIEILPPPIGWARTWGDTTHDFGFGVAADDVGNSYVTGQYLMTVDFDPGEGVDEHTAFGGPDVFLSKFDAKGDFQWARTWGAMSGDRGCAVAVDRQGDCYVTGYFETSYGDPTVDFDPGPGVEERSTNGGLNVFLSKFDSSGEFQWVVTLLNSQWSRDEGADVAADEEGNAYITGLFYGTVDFDPGPSVAEYTSQGQEDAFLAKYTSDGELLWARTWGGYSEDRGQGVAVDDLGNAYVTGDFVTADFDPGPGIEEHSAFGSKDAYLSKFSADGEFEYVRIWGGAGWDRGLAVAADNVGNAWVTGIFEETVDFDPGPGDELHTSNGSYEVFLSKFDAGGELQWVGAWGGEYFDEGNGVAVDGEGSAYVTGYFSKTVDFDPGPGIEERSADSSGDIFLVKFDTAGDFLWAVTTGGGGSDIGYDVATDRAANVFVTGYFQDTVDFDPGPWIDEHIENGYINVFLAKYTSGGTW